MCFSVFYVIFWLFYDFPDFFVIFRSFLQSSCIFCDFHVFSVKTRLTFGWVWLTFGWLTGEIRDTFKNMGVDFWLILVDFGWLWLTFAGGWFYREFPILDRTLTNNQDLSYRTAQVAVQDPAQAHAHACTVCGSDIKWRAGALLDHHFSVVLGNNAKFHGNTSILGLYTLDNVYNPKIEVFPWIWHCFPKQP